MNPDPLTVSVKAAPPALVNAGVIPLVSGTELAATTTWLTAVEVLPEKFVSPP
jgi:hypothetical protein